MLRLMLRLITTIYNKEFISKDASRIIFYPPDETFKKKLSDHATNKNELIVNTT
jgi:hypothetical protein